MGSIQIAELATTGGAPGQEVVTAGGATMQDLRREIRSGVEYEQPQPYGKGVPKGEAFFSFFSRYNFSDHLG